jgi:hypothetical protein
MDWIWFDSLTRNQRKAGTLGESGEQEMTLHHSKVQANADARACAKWQKSVTGKLFLPLRNEALRIKLLRFREVFLSAVQRIRSEQNNPAFRNEATINLDIA